MSTKLWGEPDAQFPSLSWLFFFLSRYIYRTRIHISQVNKTVRWIIKLILSQVSVRLHFCNSCVHYQEMKHRLWWDAWCLMIVFGKLKRIPLCKPMDAIWETWKKGKNQTNGNRWMFQDISLLLLSSSGSLPLQRIISLREIMNSRWKGRTREIGRRCGRGSASRKTQPTFFATMANVANLCNYPAGDNATFSYPLCQGD